jgi:hypothetical protein
MANADDGCGKRFDDPIVLPDGKLFVTLRDAMPRAREHRVGPCVLVVTAGYTLAGLRVLS